jgi:hypothetical protein
MGIIAVPNPNHEGGSAVTRSFRTGTVKHADSFSVARVRPRTSKGITDLLLLTVTRLDAACPSKKRRDGRDRGRGRGRHRPPSCPDDRRRRFPHRESPASRAPLPALKIRRLFSRLESRSLSELTRQIAPPTKNGHAPPPTESRKSSQSVNPSSVRAW